MMIKKEYTRRKLLGRLGGLSAYGALLPFVPYTEVEAAVAKPRYFAMATPVAPSSGVMNPSLPAGGGEVSELSWRGAHAALNEIKNKHSFYRGMHNIASDHSDTKGGHGDRFYCYLTGVPLKKGKIGAGSVVHQGCGFDEHSSIDQFVADDLRSRGIVTPLRDMRFGWAINVQDTINAMSFRKGVKMAYEGDPIEMFNALMKVSAPGGGASEAESARKQNIIDVHLADIKSVEKQLSSIDKKRLDQHLTAVNEVQKSLESVGVAQTGNGCQISTNIVDGLDTNDYRKASIDFAKLVALAFNCDLTRVATGLYGPTYEHIGISGRYHKATHNNDGNTMRKMMNYRAEIYVETLKELDKFDDASGGTLLDSSIVHWYHEMMANHDRKDMFNCIGGGAGHFLMGKQVRTSNNKPHNTLLVSIANAMGSKIENFGSYNTGPLSSSVLA